MDKTKPTDQTIAVSVKPGGFMEIQSGIARRDPKIYCRLVGSGDVRREAYVLVHPTSNFHNHYLAKPLAARGATVLLVNTRYVGNDSMLLMERAIQDLGAAIATMRACGFGNITLIGNSGGGSMSAMYQEQAERLTIKTTPDGRAFDLKPEQLPPVDRMALVCAHPGRAEQLLAKIDPAARDRSDPWYVDPALDMFDPANGPPYDRDWLIRYRRAQAQRLSGIEEWVVARIAELEKCRSPEAADEAFLIQRTQADPRMLDLTIDRNDRKQGTIQGDARQANFAANSLARFSTLRSFLSQWSPRHSRAHGPRCLANTTTPVLVVNHTADQAVFPSQIDDWMRAAGSRGERYDLKGAPHYADDRPELVEELADLLVRWSRRTAPSARGHN